MCVQSKMFKKKIFSIVLIKLTLAIAVKCCEPAEEGTRYAMTAFVTLHDNGKDIVWKRNSDVVAACLSNKPCESTFSHLYSISKSFVSTGHYNISLTILNVTRGFPVFAANMWTLVSGTEPDRIYFGCHLQVSAPVSNPTCNFTLSSSGFNASCFVSRVYPNASCHLEFFIDKKLNFTLTNVSTTSINWSTTEPVYYNTSCSVHVHHSSLRPGLQELHMAVYPNLTNSTQDKKYGQTVVHKVTLEPPTIEIKVLNYTDVNGLTTVTCLCYRTDSSQNETTILWYRNNSLIQHNNGTIVATFEASSSYDDYYCQATNVFGWTSQNVTCRPTEEKDNKTAQSVQNSEANSSNVFDDGGGTHNITSSTYATAASNNSIHHIEIGSSRYILVIIVFVAVLGAAAVCAVIFWKTIYPRVYHTTKIQKNEYELKGDDTDGLKTTWCMEEDDTESHYEELDKFSARTRI